MRVQLCLAAVVAALLLAALAGCGGGTKVVTKTVSGAVASSPIPAAPSITPTTTGSADDGSAKITNRVIGDGRPARDGSMLLRVRNLEVVTGSLPPKEFSSTITPVPGAKLVVIELVASNEGLTPTTPFCGGTGSVLIDTGGRNYDPDNRTIDLRENSAYCESLQPGFQATYRILYQVPRTSVVRAIGVWDDNEPGDSDGEQSWVRFARAR